MKVDEAFELVEKEIEISDELSYMEAVSVLVRTAFGLAFEEECGDGVPDRKAAREVLQLLRDSGAGPFSREVIWGGVLMAFGKWTGRKELESNCRAAAVLLCRPGELDRFIEGFIKSMIRQAVELDVVPEDIDLGDFE